MFITSFGEQNITYKCCSNFLIHLYSTKKQFKGRELSRRLNLIDQAYTRQYFGHIPELKEGVKTQIKTFAERAYKLCKRGEW